MSSITLRSMVVLFALMPACRSLADDLEAGRRLYEEGVVASGAPLVGVRPDNVVVRGREAACATCHRRSGLGAVEGDIQVPPVAGRFLFAQSGDWAVATMDPHSGKRMNQAHEPYTSLALARAVRDGVNVNGHAMNTMMPRYTLSDSDGVALESYLRQLSAQWSPGVTAETIRFATVIAPGVDPVRKEALLTTLRAAFMQKNANTVSGRAGGRRRMVSAAEMVLGTGRIWQLEVWELSGAPETWQEQLEQRYRDAPVFALVSGIAADWSPIDHFCHAQQIPCWFPSVDSAGKESGDYSLHFSRGVTLEAEVLAKHLNEKRSPPRHVVQIYGNDGAEAEAAARFKQLYAKGRVEDRIARDEVEIASALKNLKPHDVVVGWLKPHQLTQLEGIAPPREEIYFSAVLAGDPFAVPRAWRRKAALLYPYELPERRAANTEYFRVWLNIRGLPLTDERLQSEVYFAVDYLAATLSEMLDNLQRDYLLERAVDMLSRNEAAKAEDATRVVLTAGPATNRPRSGSTLYPRLSLALGQHFASKGAYLVGFAGRDRERLVPLSDWVVP